MKKRIISSPAFTWFVAKIVCMYSRTFRLTIQNEQPWRDHLEGGGRVILCSWHQQFFSFVRHFRGYGLYQPGLMISQSADGALIAGVARQMGWKTIRGSSSRGGLKAMLGMIEHLREHRMAGHIVDGPRGPMGVIKKGVIHMARESNAVLVPVYAEAANSWKFRSWDRFFIPKPFSPVCIRFGDMITPVPEEHSDAFERQRVNLETTMLAGLVR